MNKAEEAAYNWLKTQELNPVYQPRKTPDFLTESGGFEVKRLYGHSILFTPGQVEKVRETNSKVLVFSNGGKAPLVIIEPEDLSKQIVSDFMIKVIETSRQPNSIQVVVKDFPDEKWDGLKIYAIREKVTLKEALERAVDTLLLKDGDEKR